MNYKINKQKCTSCQVCIQNCPGATRIGNDGKAEIIDQEKLEQCGGESVCPFGAIEKIDKEKKSEKEIPSSPTPPTQPLYSSPSFEGKGLGRGRGIGTGRGRGLGRGRGPGRGRGMGGSGRRR